MKYTGAVFFDVDGTLIDGASGIHEPSKKTIEAIKELKDKGYLILISTGRPASMLDKRILTIDPNGIIASNGTYAIIDGQEVLNHAIDKDELKGIVKFLEDNNIGYVLEGQEISYVDKCEKRNTWGKVQEFSIEMDAFTREWELDDVVVHKLTVFTESDEEMEKVLNFNEDYSIMRHTGFTSSDFYRNKYSKGYAIKELIENLNIPKDKTFAFGDGTNDIEMFQEVKYGIAMGGAAKELLEHAYFKTSTVEEEGIYNGLKKLELI